MKKHKSINIFIRHYNRVLILLMYSLTIYFVLFVDWTLLLYAIPFGIFERILITSIVYHRLWSHQTFIPKPWVNNFGAVLGFMHLYPTPRQYYIEHIHHHIHADTAQDDLYPGHSWLHRYMPWLWFVGKANGNNPIYIEESKKLGDQFIKTNPWANWINLEKRLLIIHAGYLTLYLISVKLFMIFIIASAFMHITSSMLGSYTHKFDKNKQPTTVDLPLLAWFFFSNDFFHAHHHKYPKDNNFGHPIITKFEKFITTLLTKK